MASWRPLDDLNDLAHRDGIDGIDDPNAPPSHPAMRNFGFSQPTTAVVIPPCQDDAMKRHHYDTAWPGRFGGGAGVGQALLGSVKPFPPASMFRRIWRSLCSARAGIR